MYYHTIYECMYIFISFWFRNIMLKFKYQHLKENLECDTNFDYNIIFVIVKKENRTKKKMCYYGVPPDARWVSRQLEVITTCDCIGKNHLGKVSRTVFHDNVNYKSFQTILVIHDVLLFNFIFCITQSMRKETYFITWVLYHGILLVEEIFFIYNYDIYNSRRFYLSTKNGF